MLKLHQFVASHFNEKARWALDYKKLPHERITYLPGLHFKPIKKLSGGPTTTPVLEHENGAVSGSAALIDWLEKTFPESPLYPSSEDHLREALAFQQRWDEQIGPMTRTAIFSVLVQEPDYLCKTFSYTKALQKRLAYRSMLPIAMPMIKKGNGVNAENVERAFKTSTAALDEVAERVARTGFIVGDQFSVADLTAASLLTTLCNVPHPDVRRQEPLPQRLVDFIAQFADHPAIGWVYGVYRDFRPPVVD